MKEIIFWGATGQAKVLRECLKDSPLHLCAMFDNNEEVCSPFQDVPIFWGRKGFEEWLEGHKTQESVGFLVAIGGNRGKDRVEIQDFLESYQMEPLKAVHPRAFVAENAKIGEGSQILAHSTICVDVQIGRGCIINTGAIVDHECQLADGVHVCPGAHLAGCVQVESFSMIGTGAILLPHIKVGQGAIVGAGAVVTKDVRANTVVAGNPARVLDK